MMFHRLPDSQKILASILTEHSDIDALTSDLLNNLAACNEVLGKYVDDITYTSCQNQYLFLCVIIFIIMTNFLIIIIIHL
jgi:hypothetical protein